MEDTRYKAFDKVWFEKNQVWLLMLAKLRLLKAGRMIRPGERIYRIYSNGVIIYLGPKKLKARLSNDHWYMARKVAAQFKYLWSLFHSWDMNIANPYFPILNLGYDTYTPTTDDGYDGQLSRSMLPNGGSWSEVRTGTGTGFSDTKDLLDVELTNVDVQGLGYGEYEALRRVILVFDTSPIGEGATTTDAEIVLWCGEGSSPFPVFGYPDLDIVSANPDDEENMDQYDYLYTKFGTTVYASYTYTEWYTTYDGTFHGKTLSSAGQSYIDPEGYTSFGLRLSWDTDNNEPTQVNTDHRNYFAIPSVLGSSGIDPPEIEITYTPGGSQIVFML